MLTWLNVIVLCAVSWAVGKNGGGRENRKLFILGSLSESGHPVRSCAAMMLLNAY